MSKKRRTFTAQFKLETVIEGLRGEKSVAHLCRERDIPEALYYQWRETFIERAAGIFTERRNSGSESQVALGTLTPDACHSPASVTAHASLNHDVRL
jgi:transposase-like protein